MIKLTATVIVAVLAVQSAVAWFFPVPYGMDWTFFTVSSAACLAGIVVGAALGSLKFLTRKPQGVLAGVLIILGGTAIAIYYTIEFYDLYHLGGVPDDFAGRITRSYAIACFALFFLFGFVGLELGLFGLRVRATSSQDGEGSCGCPSTKPAERTSGDVKGTG